MTQTPRCLYAFMPCGLIALWPYGLIILAISRNHDVVDLGHVIYEWLLRELSTALPSCSSEVRYPIIISLLLYTLYRNPPKSTLS